MFSITIIFNIVFLNKAIEKVNRVPFQNLQVGTSRLLPFALLVRSVFLIVEAISRAIKL